MSSLKTVPKNGSAYPIYPQEWDGVLVTQAQLGEILGLSKATVWAWRKRGWITPVQREGHCNLYQVPTLEEIARIKDERRQGFQIRGKESIAVAALAAGAAVAAQARERRGQGLVTFKELRAHLCVGRSVLLEWIKEGRITPALTMGRRSWFHLPSDELVQELRRQRREQIRARRPEPAPSKKAVASPAPNTLTLDPFVCRTIERANISQGADDKPNKPAYDAAVALGRSDVRFASVLGFNLLAHPTQGFRPAPVNEAPTEGWQYHERHYLNGYRQWAVRAQRSKTGEIIL